MYVSSPGAPCRPRLILPTVLGPPPLLSPLLADIQTKKLSCFCDSRSYWRTIKPVSVTSLGRRTSGIRNPILPGRVYEVYERTQTQSTQVWLTKVHIQPQSISIRNMLPTSAGMVVCVSINSRSRFLQLFLCVLWRGETIHPTVIVSERTKLRIFVPAMSTLVQLLALYTYPESHNTPRCRQTDRQTDGRADEWRDDTNSRSYCEAV